MEILLATHNQHKKDEIISILPENIKTKFIIKTFLDFNFNQEIEETGSTFEENAFIKANTAYNKFLLPSFADDSGLVIEALNGEPGIYSARYADSGKFSDNIEKVLQKMKNKENRKAYFISIICWIDKGNATYFEGRIDGKITTEIRGIDGFGYDPIFIPNNSNLSFGEISSIEKNKISHRKIALDKFINFLTINQ